MHSTFHAVCGQQKGQTELKAMCDWYLGRDTIHVSPAQVSRCIDASMHRYDLNLSASLVITIMKHLTAISRNTFYAIWVTGGK